MAKTIKLQELKKQYDFVCNEYLLSTTLGLFIDTRAR